MYIVTVAYRWVYNCGRLIWTQIRSTQTYNDWAVRGTSPSKCHPPGDTHTGTGVPGSAPSSLRYDARRYTQWCLHAHSCTLTHSTLHIYPTFRSYIDDNNHHCRPVATLSTAPRYGVSLTSDVGASSGRQTWVSVARLSADCHVCRHRVCCYWSQPAYLKCLVATVYSRTRIHE